METIPTPQINQPAPPFQLPDLEGRLHALMDFRGKVVILNFWSAECPWSERVDRDLFDLVMSWGTAVVLLPIASNANEGLELLSTTAAARGIPRVLIDADHRVADLYGAQTTPHFFVIDREGDLRYKGAFDDVTFRQRTPRVQYLKSAVEAVLAGRQPEPAETPPYGCALVRFSL
jgi:peroxiredoxin